MMNNTFTYKGYHTRIEYDAEEKILYGKIEGIRDLVTFESDNLQEIEREFHDAVDDYLEFCAEVGKDPDKEYKGTFNVRISPELHRKTAALAYLNNESLNQIVEKAIDAYVNGTYISENRWEETFTRLDHIDAALENQNVTSSTAPKISNNFDWTITSRQLKHNIITS